MSTRPTPTPGAPPPAGGALSLLLARIGGVAGSLVAGQLVLGVTYVVGARSIDPATLGLVATVAALGQVAATVLDAGLINYTVRESAAGRIDAAAARGLVRTKRPASVLVLAVGVVAGLLLLPPAAGLLLALTGPAAWEAKTANGLLRGRERFSVASGGQLTGRVAGLAVAVVLVPLGVGELALATAIPASFLVEAVVDRFFLGPPRAARAPVSTLLGHQREAVGYGLADLAASAQQLDTPLVTAGGGAVAAGLYAAAGRLIGPLTFLASSVGMVAAPWLARAGADPARLRAEERRVVLVSGALALAPLLAAVVGPPLIPLLLGADYASSSTVFVVLAVGAAVVTLNQPLALIAQNRGRQRPVAAAIAAGLAVGLVATFVLSLLGGAVWAAVGYVISQLVIFVLLALIARSARRAGPARPPGAGPAGDAAPDEDDARKH